MKDRYIYPALFDFAPEGISVEFPDLPGCLTCGDTLEEALHNAKEALELSIYCMEEDGDTIPEPSELTSIDLESNQRTVLVEIWMPQVRDEMKNKPVKKTLTIPAWLNEVAERNNVNFSHILQDALKSYLGVTDHPKEKL